MIEMMQDLVVWRKLECFFAETVIKGEMYCGPIDVLGTAFDACYNPIKDAAGKIIGVSYIGHKK